MAENKLTNFFTRGVKVGHAQKAIIGQGDGEMNSSDWGIGAEIMHGLLKHASQYLQ